MNLMKIVFITTAIVVLTGVGFIIAAFYQAAVEEKKKPLWYSE